MFDAESMRQLSDMMDQKFEVNNAKLKEELKTELSRVLKKEIGEELKVELSRVLKKEIGEELKVELSRVLKKEIGEELKVELSQVLKEEIGEELKVELSRVLKKEIGEELKVELSQVLKEEIGEELKTELSSESDSKLAVLRDEWKSDIKLLNLKMDMNIARIESEMIHIKDDVRDIKMAIEEDLNPKLRILAENYVPAAKRYAAKSGDIDVMKAEISLLNYTVECHSGQLKALLQTT